MTHTLWRRAALLAIGGSLLTFPTRASAQYFGRNKVQYQTFDWRILRTDHFDTFFYPAESVKVNDAGREAERWYARYSDLFRHAFDRKSVILYADHPDFEQTNVVGDELTEGTGGVTEGLRTRVIMPFTGLNRDDNHVLGHELVHVFQYNIAEGAPNGGLQRMGVLPLWLIEGMAEYFSLGREDPLTAMWMRDAVMRDKFPTIHQLTTDPKFFPYRYGQALWAYVGGRWGDRAVVDLYRAALRVGWDQALVRVLGRSGDSLSADWAAANRAMYRPQLAGRTHPDSVGQIVVGMRRSGDYNLAPTLSPDGNLMAFFSSRSLFSIDLFIADAHTGRIIKKLAGPQTDSHIDAISFVNSAGDWSPDGSKFAFIVYADGDNEIAILNTRSTDVERRLHVPGVGAITHVSWSPDGKSLAFSGMAGGVSDLYLLDLESGQVRQLTNDKYGDLQPTFSPDGKTIAFATDRGPNTNFDRLEFGELNLATYDIASGRVEVFAPFNRGKHINPQFSPDGADLYFVSDQDGISDVYRLRLATGQVFRVTKVATGISGITSISPAISVARRTGRLIFDVFKDQGQMIEGLDAAQTVGTLVDPATEVVNAAILPPGAGERSVVTAYLRDANTGLVSGREFAVAPYRPRFSLDALYQPTVGVSTGGTFGTTYGGGVAGYFGDQLNDQQIVTIVQANGTIRDFGGAVFYSNLKHRLNWGAGIDHEAFLSGGIFQGPCGADCFEQARVIQRLFYDQASATGRYPLSATRRIELNASATRIAMEQDIESIRYFSDHTEQTHQRVSGGPPLAYVQPGIALVGDNSFSAFTGPVSGTRYRFEYMPVFGNIQFQTALADWRRYKFVQPVSFAVRAMHYGRYGKDSEGQLYPLYLGEETWIRGYGYGSFREQECLESDPTGQGCPVFYRLFGSRVLVANLEMRIPLVGTKELGLLNFPFLPVEIAPFFDAGLAYTSDQKPEFRWATNAGAPTGCVSTVIPGTTGTSGSAFPCATRIPVFSTGITARVNVLGYMVVETYLAHPFQRPGRPWVMGVQLAPGW